MIQTYKDLSRELQEEFLCNSICLNIVVEKLSEMTGVSIKVIIQEISEIANEQVDSMSDKQIKKAIAQFDKSRENLKEISPNGNGAILQSKGNSLATFRPVTRDDLV